MICDWLINRADYSFIIAHSWKLTYAIPSPNRLNEMRKQSRWNINFIATVPGRILEGHNLAAEDRLTQDWANLEVACRGLLPNQATLRLPK